MSGISSVVSSAAIQGAYQSSQKLKVAPNAETAKAATSFTEMVGSAVQNVAETARGAEAAATSGLKGEIGTQAVVEATMELETTLRTAVAVRDKVVEAYQEIMRMPI